MRVRRRVSPCFLTMQGCRLGRWVTIPYVYILLEYVRGGRLMFPGVPWVRWAQGKGLGQGSGVGLVSPTPLNLWHITPLTPLHAESEACGLRSKLELKTSVCVQTLQLSKAKGMSPPASPAETCSVLRQSVAYRFNLCDSGA